MSKSVLSNYPLTGFSKITYEEFLGILEMLQIFSKLNDRDKEVILLLMDGMKYRDKKNSTH